MKSIEPHEAHKEFSEAWQFLKAHLPMDNSQEYIAQFATDISKFEHSRKTDLGVEMAAMMYRYLGECIKKEV